MTMNKSDLKMFISFNYSKQKTEDNVSEASLEDDFNYSTIITEEEEKAQIMKGIRNVTLWIEKEPQNHNLLTKRSKLFLKLGSFTESSKDAQAAINIKNDSIDPFFLLGQSLSGQDRFGESELAFKRAIEIVTGIMNRCKPDVRFVDNLDHQRKECQERITMIEREMRHLRYNTLHSMGFDPIVALKVSSKTSSINEAINMMTHIGESANVPKRPVEGSVWETGNNICQRIQIINSLESIDADEKRDRTSSTGSSLTSMSTSSDIFDGHLAKSSSSFSVSSQYSTPSHSPPVANGSSRVNINLFMGGDQDFPPLSRFTVSEPGQEPNEETEENESWKVVGKKIKIKSSTPTKEMAMIGAKRPALLPTPEPQNVERLKVVNNNVMSTIELAKEHKVLNFRHSPSPTGEKRRSSPFVAKIPVSDRRPTNVFKFHGIWVGGISPKVRTIDLTNLFAKYGKIITVRHLSQSSHCIFVNYSNDQDPINALMDLNNKCVPSISLFPSSFVEVRFAPTDKQLAKFHNMTRDMAQKVANEAGECFGWRNSEGCPNYNDCKFAHRPECREIDSRPWIKLLKLREKIMRRGNQEE